MEGFLVCAGLLGSLLIFFGFILLMRWISYKETMTMIEKGLVRPPKKARRNGKGALVWGILLAAVGVALTIGLWPLGNLVDPGRTYPMGFGPWMVIGLLPLFFGLALILIHVLTYKEEKDEPAYFFNPNLVTPQEQVVDASVEEEIAGDQEELNQ